MVTICEWLPLWLIWVPTKDKASAVVDNNRWAAVAEDAAAADDELETAAARQPLEWLNNMSQQLLATCHAVE